MRQKNGTCAFPLTASSTRTRVWVPIVRLDATPEGASAGVSRLGSYPLDRVTLPDPGTIHDHDLPGKRSRTVTSNPGGVGGGRLDQRFIRRSGRNVFRFRFATGLVTRLIHIGYLYTTTQRLSSAPAVPAPPGGGSGSIGIKPINPTPDGKSFRTGPRSPRPSAGPGSARARGISPAPTSGTLPCPRA